MWNDISTEHVFDVVKILLFSIMFVKVPPFDIHIKFAISLAFYDKCQNFLLSSVLSVHIENTLQRLIQHICHRRHPRSGCRNFKVRGIFSIFYAKGTPVESCSICIISHTVCDFTHNEYFFTQCLIYTQYVIFHTVRNFTQWVILNTVCNSTRNV